MGDCEVDDNGDDEDDPGVSGRLLERLLVFFLCEHISNHQGLSVVAQLGWEFYDFLLFLPSVDGAEMALTKSGGETQNIGQWSVSVASQFATALQAGECGLSFLPVDRHVDEEITLLFLAAEHHRSRLTIVEFVIDKLVW